MTLPEGSAWVDVHANTDPFGREIERGVRRGAEAADDDLKDAGEDMGDALADGMGGRLKSRIPGISREVERGFAKRKIKADVDFDIDEGLIPDEIERAFARAFRPGGPLDNLEQGIGKAVSSGIGAGFNVSGRGPLILLLLPFIGAIGALIAGAVQAVNGLIALLYLVPSLIGAIALQAGVLFLAFRGVGEAIAKAFSAKTPQEFEKALEGLSPQLQTFIRSLMPLRDLFNDLSDLAQRNFFGAFGSILADFARFMRFNLVLAVDRLSTAFGGLFRSLVLFFGTPTFQTFFAGLIDSTEKWLQLLEPALVTLLTGFADLGIAVKPFLDWFGGAVAKGLSDFGRWLSGLKVDQEFLSWLEDMKDTLRATWDFFGRVIVALKEFAQAIDEAGGKELIGQLMYLVDQIIIFLNTEFGVKSLKGLMGTLLELTYIAVILIGGILSFFGILYYFVDWLVNTAGPAIKDFFVNLYNDLIDFFVARGNDIVYALSQPYEQAKTAVITAWNNALTFLQSIPDQIKGFFANAGTWLIEAGRTIINGLIAGIKEKLGPLGWAIDQAAQIIRDPFPFSPAKTGPLSGSGDPFIAGQKIIQRLAAGIQMETPALAAASSQAAGNIIFGPGSVKVGFEGVVPTPEQAQMTGAAAGRGIVNALAVRNTRLQVRTM